MGGAAAHPIISIAEAGNRGARSPREVHPPRAGTSFLDLARPATAESWIREEGGTGIDKVVGVIEAFQLPAPDFQDAGYLPFWG